MRALGALVMALVSIGCESATTHQDLPTLESPAAAAREATSATPGDLRAWIQAIHVIPVLPTKDQVLTATVDWQPQGRPGTSASFRWLVNGEEVKVGPSSELELTRFRTGDRVSVLVTLTHQDGRVLASERSQSVVIQNRPPGLTAEFDGLHREEEELVGRIPFSDPDGDAVSVTLRDGPPGLIVEADGRVRWPVSQAKSGPHQLTLELEDERGLGYRGTLAFSLESDA